MIRMLIYLLGLLPAIGFCATGHYWKSALVILATITITELLYLIKSDNHNLSTKFMTIITTIISIIIGFGGWHYVRNYKYRHIKQHNQLIINNLLSSEIKQDKNITEILNKLDKLHYFTGLNLYNKAQLHNHYLDYVRMQIYIKLLPDVWYKNHKYLDQIRDTNIIEILKHFQKYRQHIKNSTFFIHPENYDQFSIFAAEMNMVKFIFHYGDGEYEDARYLVEEHSGLRVIDSDYISIAQLILNSRDDKKLQEFCRVYYQKTGLLSEIIKHMQIPNNGNDNENKN